ncbi:MAG: cytochrome P450, partial [Myxococcota bacterium]
PKLAYLPFGGGARACIGKVFALIEGHLLLAHLTQRFRFRLDGVRELQPQPRVTLAPRGGVPMVIEGRTRRRDDDNARRVASERERSRLPSTSR